MPRATRAFAWAAEASYVPSLRDLFATSRETVPGLTLSTLAISACLTRRARAPRSCPAHPARAGASPSVPSSFVPFRHSPTPGRVLQLKWESTGSTMCFHERLFHFFGGLIMLAVLAWASQNVRPDAPIAFVYFILGVFAAVAVLIAAQAFLRHTWLSSWRATDSHARRSILVWGF